MMSAEKRILFLSRDRGSVQTMIPVISRLHGSNGVSLQVIIPDSCRDLLSEPFFRSELLDEDSFLFDPVAYIDEILDRVEPDLVVSGSSPARSCPPDTPEQYLILRARRRGIRSVAILDFWGMYAERFISRGDQIDSALMPDKLCVLDRHCRDELIGLGAVPEQLVITHNPWLDSLTEQVVEAPDSSVLLDRHDLRVLFVSQPYEETRAIRGWPFTQGGLLQGLLDALPPAQPGRRHLVLIWIHPAETADRWQSGNLCERSDVVLRICKTRGASVLAHVDLVLSGHSTVTYEALHLGTPCVFFRPGSPRLPSQIAESMGLVELVDSMDALRAMLSRFNAAESRAELECARRRLVTQGNFFSDGQATRKVLRVIDSLLKA